METSHLNPHFLLLALVALSHLKTHKKHQALSKLSRKAHVFGRQSMLIAAYATSLSARLFQNL